MTQNDPKKGPSGQLDLTMVGEVVIHDGFGVAFLVLITDLGEFGLEDLIGHSAGILEFAQAVVGEDVQVAIGDCGFEGAATVVRFAVLRVREPTEEVLRTVVQRVFNEMVADTEVALTFAVDEGGAFSVEDLAHKDVAQTRFVMSQIRRGVAAVFGFCTHLGAVLMCYFSPGSIEEIGASLVRPEVETRVFAITLG